MFLEKKLKNEIHLTGTIKMPFGYLIPFQRNMIWLNDIQAIFSDDIFNWVSRTDYTLPGSTQILWRYIIVQLYLSAQILDGIYST